MVHKLFRWIFGICLIILSSFGLLWNTLPVRKQTRNLILPAIISINQNNKIEGIPCNLILSVGWPGRIHLGDIQHVDLSLTVRFPSTTGESTETGIIEENVQGSEGTLIHIKNGLIMESRLEFPELKVLPNGLIQWSYDGRPFSYSWQLEPHKHASYIGYLWLYSSSDQLTAEGGKSRQLIASIPIDVEVVYLFGLRYIEELVLCFIGVVLGFGLCLDLFFPSRRMK